MPWHDRQLVTATLLLLGMAVGCSKHVESNADKAADAPSSAVPAGLKTNASTEAAIVTQPSGRKPWVRVAEIDSVQRFPTGPTASAYPPTNPDNLSNPNVMSFLDDDKLLLADGKYGIRIFSAINGKELGRFGSPLADVPVNDSQRRVFASPDGRLAMILPDPEPKIWQTDTGTCVGVLPRLDQSYMLAAFYPDGKRVATLQGKSYVNPPPINLHLWELTDGPPRQLASERASFWRSSLIYCAPYLLADGPVLAVHDPDTLRHLKDGWSAERNARLLWSQPQTESSPAQIGTIQLSAGAASTDTSDSITIDVTSLGDGRKLKSYVCPRGELEGDRNGNRSERSYRVSADHEVIAVSTAGRIEFIQLDGCKRLWAPDPYPSNYAEATFLPRSRVALSHVPTPFRIYDYRGGRILTEIPGILNRFDDAYSPSGNCVAVHASSTPVRSGTITSDFERIEIWRQRDSD
jgi:hypothetical protein